MLPCSWEEGFEVSYTYTRTRQGQGIAYGPRTMTSPASVAVLASGDQPVFRNTWGETTMEGGGEDDAKLLQTMNKMADTPLDVRMVEGVVTEVVNYDEVLAAMTESIRAMMEGQPDEALERALQMYQDRAAGTQLMLKDASKLFAMHCVGLAAGQEISLPMDQPSALGVPVRVLSTVAFDAHDPDAGTLTIRTEDRTDSESIKRLLDALIGQMLPPDADEEQAKAAMAQLPPIASVMTGAYVMSTTDGFPVEVTVVQEVSMPGMDTHNRRDTWTWTRN